MEPRKHRTPSGLPPANFDEPAEVWDFVKKPANELDLIIEVGVWAPEDKRAARLRKSRSKPSAEPLFAPQDETLNTLSTIAWWEKRRLTFNLILLMAGVPVLAVLWLVTLAFRDKMDGLGDAISRGDTLFDPVALLWLLIGANVCFTVGWIADLTARFVLRLHSPSTLGPSLLAASLWLSLAALGFLSIGLLHFAIGR